MSQGPRKIVKLKEGPWTGLDLTVRPAAVHPNEPRMSLPIKVGQHHGRYNLQTGEWVAL